MYVEIDNSDNKVKLYADEEDLCYLCVYTVECPLLNAVHDEAVVLRYENIGIEKCAMHKEITLDQMIAF